MANPKSQPKSAKSPPKKKPGRPRKNKPSGSPLPPPVEPESQRSAQKGPSLVPPLSESFSTSSTSDDSPLSPEAERLLSGIPAQIGDELPAEGAAEAAGEDGELSGLMAGYIFSQEDVHDTLIEFFDFLGDYFKSDHWKLKERQARMLAEPGTQLVNASWQKIAQFLPEALQRWCEQTPGLVAFVLASGFIVLPRVKTQITISRERSKPKPRVVPTAQSPGVQTIDNSAPIMDGPGPFWGK